MINVQRVYEPVHKRGGKRFLVDRLWPRGIAKADLPLAGWVKDVAPSNALRKWFHHDEEKWPEFQQRYKAELQKQPDAWAPIASAAREGDVTLLYGAKDTAHNNAVVLKEFLEEQAGR